MDNKKVIIIGGGTVCHIRPHLALSAPAYGNTARQLGDLCWKNFDKMDTEVHLTKMAGGQSLETNEDINEFLQELKEDDTTKIIFLTAALCDFTAVPVVFDPYTDMEHWLNTDDKAGKYGERLKTSQYNEKFPLYLRCIPAEKIISKVRQGVNARKDIFLVGFKTTSGATEDEQYITALNLCKASSCNLVFANDVKTRLNMIVTPEEARYHVTKNRQEALEALVDMTKLRSNLTFTQSTVVAGSPIPWDSEMIPNALRIVVDYCIERGAYKPFRGSTAGHFACKLNDTTFLTSIRKTDFNDLKKNGLVKVETSGPDTVIAYGAKPSVGGQSQRIVFNDHPGYDSILHFHSPIKEGSLVPVRSQREFECGSASCGKNTSDGLKQFGNLKAVYLDNHGPNIVFNKSIDPQEVIDFIEANFDLELKTGGFVSLNKLNTVK